MLEPESVHAVITSPPYWGLRSYGIGTENGELGLEPNFNDYVANMVAVFRELRRVLRNDGTVWLNLGDSYSSHDPGGYREGEFLNPNGRPPAKGQARNRAGNHTDIPRKNLIGIPWRVAFALQADGWWLRQDLIWSKPNPMPESVTDRCTKSHEYLFLLTKSERYYYDAEAIREPLAVGSPIWGEAESFAPGYSGNVNVRGEKGKALPANPAGRNKRSVWEIATAPFAEAHFATFPPALIEPCILAGCPKECCAKCGAPWVRQTETSYANPGNRSTNGPRSVENRSFTAGFEQRLEKRTATLGWSPSCSCNADTAPGVCLDPFFGAGTTGLVADRLGRNCIGIELSPTYAAMAERRIKGDCPLFTVIAPPAEAAE